MKVGDVVVYIDRSGKEHNALVARVNPFSEGEVDLDYMQDEAVSKREFSVHHKSKGEKEPNPELPHYDLNCYKEVGESHAEIPSDHPNFDHPYALPETDPAGHVIEKQRPEYDQHVADHQGARAEADEKAAKEAEAQAVKDAKKSKKNGSDKKEDDSDPA